MGTILTIKTALPRAGCAALAAAVLLTGCDSREQKPKVESAARHSFFSVAYGQTSDRVVPPAAMTGAMAPVDEAFALYAASSGLAEIEGARLALKSARRTEVREYAQTIVRDHTQALDALRKVVSQRGLKLPAAATGRHADMVTKLAGVAPADIEDAFLLRFGLDAHKETIALYERHAAEGQAPELRLHAQQSLDMLRGHLAAAQKLVNAPGTTR